MGCFIGWHRHGERKSQDEREEDDGLWSGLLGFLTGLLYFVGWRERERWSANKGPFVVVMLSMYIILSKVVYKVGLAFLRIYLCRFFCFFFCETFEKIGNRSR